MRHAVVWISEGTWTACVDTARLIVAPETPIALLHVVDDAVAEALHGVYDGLLGRGGHDPGTEIEALVGPAEQALLDLAAARLERPSEQWVRRGHTEREVVAACAGASLLICARDGEHDRLGPASLGKHTRFVVDHAPCAVLLVWPDEIPDLDSIPPRPH